jgi:hypothetical protein
MKHHATPKPVKVATWLALLGAAAVAAALLAGKDDICKFRRISRM